MLKIKNPYPGFHNGLHRPFDDEEVKYFCGRDQDVKNVLARIKQNKFLSIISPPKAGKTSFIKAGLIPYLSSRSFSGIGGNNWKIVYFSPSSFPILSMSRAIVNPKSFANYKIKPTLEEAVFQKLNKNDYGLIRVIEEVFNQKNQNILFIIDDFMELFNPATNEKEQKLFINLLVKALRTKDLPFYLITSMNQEDIQSVYLKEFKKLDKLVSENSYLLRFLDQRSLQEAIQKPAKIEKSEISEELSNLLIEELLADQDQLRKLQIYLHRTWFEWKKNHKSKLVTIQHYQKATGHRKKASIKAKEQTVEKEVATESSVSAHDKIDKTLEETYKYEYQELSAANQSLFKKLIQILVVKDAAGKMVSEGVEFKDASIILGKKDTDILKIVNATPTILNIDKKKIKLNNLDAFQSWADAVAWVDEEAENIKLFKKLGDAAIAHYIDGVDLDRVCNKQDYSKIKNWYDGFKPVRQWGELHHSQYDLACDLIEKLFEFYGPPLKSASPVRKKLGGKKLSLKIKSKTDEAAPKKASPAQTVKEKEIDEDAAIAALLGKTPEEPSAPEIEEKPAEKPADSEDTGKPRKKLNLKSSTRKKISIKKK